MTKLPIPKEQYALITGGSSGLGKSLAVHLAQMGYNLILVALDDSMLYETAGGIKARHGVDVKVIACDLLAPDSCDIISSQVKSFKINLAILVNNVGIGNTSFFSSNTASYNNNVIRLNCSVMVDLTLCLIPELRKNSHAYILNISSLAGLFPVPYKAVYSATKHFVKAFSFALHEELKGENITVTAVFPGSIRTNASVIQRTKSFGKLAAICSYSADEIALLSLKSLFSKKRFVIPGIMSKVYTFFRYLIGYRLTMNLVTKGMKKEAVKDFAKKEKKEPRTPVNIH